MLEQKKLFVIPHNLIHPIVNHNIYHYRQTPFIIGVSIKEIKFLKFIFFEDIRDLMMINLAINVKTV